MIAYQGANNTHAHPLIILHKLQKIYLKKWFLPKFEQFKYIWKISFKIKYGEIISNKNMCQNLTQKCKFYSP